MISASPMIDDSHDSPAFADMRSADADRRRLLSLWRFLETDRYLVRRKMAFLGTVQRKLHTGRYDRTRAPRLWAFWVDEGIGRYYRLHPRTDRTAFGGPIRMKLAREIAAWEHKRILAGAYPDLTVDGVQHGDRFTAVRWKR